MLGLLALCAIWLVLLVPAQAVTFTWLDVIDEGNGDDTTGYGGVADQYRISSTEVTNAQYAEFLNAIAASDPNGVWDANMDITRGGSDGSYTYTPTAGFSANPLNNATFFDAMRFVNWIENGTPTGAQGAGTTEDGTYSIFNGTSETRAGGATYFLPSADEWYKAAYFDGAGSYWDYPTQSNAAPTDEVPAGGANSANYNNTVTETTDVGAYSGTTSHYGGYDFGGNVYEWTEEVFGGTDRVIRGGSYTSGFGTLAATGFQSLLPTGGSFAGGVGFRIAGLIDAPEDPSDPFDFGDIPEPSRAVLLGFGVLAMLLRRRR